LTVTKGDWFGHAVIRELWQVIATLKEMAKSEPHGFITLSGPIIANNLLGHQPERRREYGD